VFNSARSLGLSAAIARAMADGDNEPFERWNTHFSLIVEQTVFE
jgi:hypothetical protein